MSSRFLSPNARVAALVLALVLGPSAAALAGCTTPLAPYEIDAGPGRDAGTDAGPSELDAPEPVDARPADAGPPDAGPPDAGPPDAGPPPCMPGTPFGAPMIVTSLSSTMFDDDGLSLTADELDAAVRSGIENTFYLHTRPDLASAFGAGTPSGVNQVNRDQGPFLSSDGLELFFASSRDTGGGAIELLHRSVRMSRAGTFGAPTRVAFSGMLGATDLNDPYLAGDSLYFSGMGPSRQRGIFVAPRMGTGDSFGSPVLVTALDSGDDDFSPVVSADGLEIFFARDGAGNGDDIVSSTRTSTMMPFGPASVAISLRTGSNEQPEALSADGCRLYFVSNRGGRWDAYVASRAAP